MMARRHTAAELGCPQIRHIRNIIAEITNFYNGNPVTSVLLLKGPFSDQDRAAHLVRNAELAVQFRQMLASDKKSPCLPKKPDAVAIAIELAFAVLSYGYVREGTLARTLSDEAVRAVIAYLSEWV